VRKESSTHISFARPTDTDHHLRFTRLLRKTLPTNDFFNRKAINGMMRIFRNALRRRHTRETAGQRGRAMHPIAALSRFQFGRKDGAIVVTDPAAKGRATTRTDQSTLAIVMRTRRSGLLQSFRVFRARGLIVRAVVERASSGHAIRIVFSVPHIRIRELLIAARTRTARDTPRVTRMTTSTAMHTPIALNTVGETVASSVHEMLDGPALLKGRHLFVRENGLDASTALRLFDMRHAAATHHGCGVVFVAHVDHFFLLLRGSRCHFVVHAVVVVVRVGRAR
jgi:hypothetical protein